MLALSFQRAGRESLFSAEHTRVERELGRFFHNNNQLRGGERISAESQQPVICQQHRGNRRMLFKLLHNMRDGLPRPTRRPISHGISSVMPKRRNASYTQGKGACASAKLVTRGE